VAIVLRSRSERETFDVGRALGGLLRPGDVVGLVGPLGAGKTVLCKGIGAALGLPPEQIVSPSFVIVAEHRARAAVFYHVDAYRLSGEAEAEGAGLGEVLEGGGICAVEWADRVRSLLPTRCVTVTLRLSAADAREVEIAWGDAGRLRLLAARCAALAEGGKG